MARVLSRSLLARERDGVDQDISDTVNDMSDAYSGFISQLAARKNIERVPVALSDEDLKAIKKDLRLRIALAG